eukprot:TRINITY_DN2773_c0_g2_i4.p1 TRINITY_DN2773_c0_g2~~TRINITY_DN2773_c0_g2_i4.p1  ORF type:complete len:148 (-),score=15.32 TRINITY_DN2773_c0_g2_i4:148-591(-)
MNPCCSSLAKTCEQRGMERRVYLLISHLPTYDEPTYSLSHEKVASVFGKGGLRNFYNNKYLVLKGHTDKWKEIIAKRPRKLGFLEAMFLWFLIILVSVPWLSYILLISFFRSRSKTVSITNAWANFILKKVIIFYFFFFSKRNKIMN